jgi:hypothetical protein
MRGVAGAMQCPKTLIVRKHGKALIVRKHGRRRSTTL